MTRTKAGFYLTDTARSALDRAGVRLGISTSAVIELLARHADKLTERDLGRLPDESRGRKGMGRRPALPAA